MQGKMNFSAAAGEEKVNHWFCEAALCNASPLVLLAMKPVHALSAHLLLSSSLLRCVLVSSLQNEVPSLFVAESSPAALLAKIEAIRKVGCGPSFPLRSCSLLGRCVERIVVCTGCRGLDQGRGASRRRRRRQRWLSGRSGRPARLNSAVQQEGDGFLCTLGCCFLDVEVLLDFGGVVGRLAG